jgi:predicted ATP-dependent endonuclease of OLD family
MKLVRAQVQNFRSVEDSGVFTVDGEITCLVGKNESGKTSLLTALNRINPILSGDKDFNWEHEYPRRFHADYKERHAGKHPVVASTWWKL